MTIILLAAPPLLVIAMRVFLRESAELASRLSWIVVGATWAMALFFSIGYTSETTDVGLIVQGIKTMAVSGSALVTTLIALFWPRAWQDTKRKSFCEL